MSNTFSPGVHFQTSVIFQVLVTEGPIIGYWPTTTHIPQIYKYMADYQPRKKYIEILKVAGGRSGIHPEF